LAREDDQAPGSGRRARPHERIEPIYRRLPRGPHSLDGAAICAHQRARIEGALVRAVSTRGYEALTVREVIGLAGVSRRSFYEQFENRHDCFLRTARALAERGFAGARRACAAAPDSASARTGAAIEALAAADPAGARLVLVETLCAGDAGAALRGEALGAGARMLSAALRGPGGETAPAPVLRVLAAVLAAMLEPLGDSARGAAASMTSIALAVAAPARAGAATVLDASLREGLRRTSTPSPGADGVRSPRRGCARTPPSGESAGADPAARADRVISSALRLASHHPVQRLSVPQIADAAGVPVDAVMSRFGDRDACVERALETAGRDVLALVERAGEVAEGPQSLRLALAGVLGHLAADPDRARGLTLVAYRSGARARSRAEQFRAELGAALL